MKNWSPKNALVHAALSTAVAGPMPVTLLRCTRVFLTMPTLQGSTDKAWRGAVPRTRRGRWCAHVACCALFLLGLGHGSAVAQTADGLRIGTIVVEGNSKTQTYLILAASELSPGMVIDGASLAQARQRILNKRVFVDASVEAIPQGTTAEVRIVVKERWTLLPIPFVASSYGENRAGVFLMDTNLLGRMKTIAAGVTFSSRGTSFAGFYLDPSLMGTRWSTRASVLWASRRQERRAGSERFYAFHEDRTDLAASIGYQIFREVFVYVGGFYLQANPSRSGDFEAPSKVDDLGGASLELNLRMADYHSYFDEGLIVRAQHRQGFIGRSADQSRAFVQFSHRTLGDQSFILTLQYLRAEGDRLVDAQRLGALVGTRGFAPQGLWASQIGTASLEYQIPVRHFSFGTWTANGFCDIGRFLWDGQTTNFMTPGLGTRFYLNNVAIPALGFDVAYSEYNGGFVTSFSLGLAI